MKRQLRFGFKNTGKTDAMVQIRVFKWNQDGLKDNYSEQSEIIPSPPVAKIKAGEKHMLSLNQKRQFARWERAVISSDCR